MIDPRDALYTLCGLAFLGLTFGPALARSRWFNPPAFYIGVGTTIALFGLPLVSPIRGELGAKVIEHTAELIVIISLAGAGLAIDTPASWRRWQPTWRLLIVVMPASIVAIVWLGLELLGLGLAAATLLGASLAPTDPVLARSVQVGPPGQDETPVKIALTAEAGLNDGLAFPFVWLAITFASLGIAEPWSSTSEWLWGWLGKDVLYRIAAGVCIGVLAGKLLTGIVFSRIGDASQGAENPTLNFLAWTLIVYGVTEAVDGYGFLAVFLSARVGRSSTSEEDGGDAYGREVHKSGDQLEAILLVLLLLWLGAFIAQDLWRHWTWSELGFAVALIFVVRPLVALVALVGIEIGWSDRLRIALFGVRGMGSIFYIAYAQNHAQFGDIDAVWRVSALVILISVVLHGFGARLAMPPDPQTETGTGTDAAPSGEDGGTAPEVAPPSNEGDGKAPEVARTR